MFKRTLTVFALLVLASSAASAILKVPSDFTNISAALTAASPGDTVAVSSGLYTGAANCNLLLTKNGLVLIGVDGPATTIVDCELRWRCVSVVGVGAVVSGFTFRNGQAPNTPSETASTATSNTVRERDGAAHRALPQRRGAAAAGKWRKTVAVIKVVLDSDGELSFDRAGARSRRERGPTQGSPRGEERRDSGATDFLASSFGGNVLVYGSYVTLRDLWVSGGRAARGGGIGMSRMQGTLSGLRVTGNGLRHSTDEYTAGGGIYAELVSGLVVRNCSVSGNHLVQLSSGLTTSSSEGGGIFVTNGMNIVFDGENTISENSVITYANSQGQSNGAGAFLTSVSTVHITGKFHALSNTVIAFQKSVGNVNCGGLEFFVASGIFASGELLARGNSITSFGGDGFVGSAGFHLQQVQNVLFSGHLLVENNAVYLTPRANATSYGAVVFAAGGNIYGGSDVVMNGTSVFRNNSIYTTAPVSALAGGLLAAFTRNAYISNITLDSNRVVSEFPGLVSTGDRLNVETNSTTHCQEQIVIRESSGTLSDGSAGNYSSNIMCTWTFETPDTFNQAFGRLSVRLKRLDISYSQDLLCIFGGVALYDGSATTAPLIGRYCGALPSYSCTADCADIVTRPYSLSGTQMVVVFDSINEIFADGFELEWTTELKPIYTVGADGVVPPLFGTYPLISSGGGIFTYNAMSFLLENAVFSNNLIVHPLLSFGAGLSITTKSASLTIQGSTFLSNIAMGSLIASGGGLALKRDCRATVLDSLFINNSAVSSGSCIQQVDLSFRCPATFGGAVMVAESELTMHSIRFEANSVSCSNLKKTGCVAHGGAVAVTRDSVATLTSSIVTKNIVMCHSAAGCVRSSGGAIFGDSGELRVAQSSIVSNSVFGVGGGGAVSAMGEAWMTIQASQIFNNSALQGGGCYVTDTATLSLQSCRIERNSASLVAGAISCSGRVAVSILDSELILNSAARINTALMYNDDKQARYTIDNNTVFAVDGTMAFIMGNLDISSSNVLFCTVPGTVYVQDRSDEFFSASFSVCDEGSYSAGTGSSLRAGEACKQCPFGARCYGGGKSSSDGFRVIAGYWAHLEENNTAVAYLCPGGLCCEDGAGCGLEYCQGSRVGTLCGRCPKGMGLRFFTESCGPDEDCRDLGWVVVVAFVFAIVFVVYLVLTTSRRVSGLFAVLLFFYQMLPLVKSSKWKSNVVVLLTLQSLGSMAPTSSFGGNSLGVCILPSMTESQRMGARIIFQPIVLVSFLAVFGAHRALSRIGALRARVAPPVTIHYVACIGRFLTISYTTLLLVPLQMLQCVTVQGRYVWFRDATIECYEQWQIVAFVVVLLLCPLPLLLIVLMQRWKHVDRLTERELVIRRLLSSGFTQKRRWYLGVSMYRRFFLVLVYSICNDLNVRGIVTSILSAVFLFLNVRLRPFGNRYVHHFENISLLSLSVLSILCLPQLSQEALGSTTPLVNEEVMEVFQFVLGLLPICAYPILQGVIIRDERRDARRAATADADVDPTRGAIVSGRPTAAPPNSLFVSDAYLHSPFEDKHDVEGTSKQIRILKTGDDEWGWA